MTGPSSLDPLTGLIDVLSTDLSKLGGRLAYVSEKLRMQTSTLDAVLDVIKDLPEILSQRAAALDKIHTGLSELKQMSDNASSE